MSDSVKKYYEMVKDGTIKSEGAKKQPWIYESPDGGKTIKRRKMHDLPTANQSYSELELTEVIINITSKYKGASPALVLQLAKDELSVKKVCD